MNIFLNTNLIPAEEEHFEVVERKGIGHPDTLADGVAESISCAYSRFCLENFGAVLHHNVDKTAFVGGMGKVDFGVGEMVKPITLILNGRMSACFGNQKIDYKTMQKKIALNYIQKVLPHLDIKKWLKVASYTSSFSRNPYWFNPRSLKDVPDAVSPYANDTSACVGHWPLSPVEKVALLLEGHFYRQGPIPKYDFVGQDIKVMCVRNFDNVEITMCIPFLSAKLPNYNIYQEKLELLRKELQEVANEVLGDKYQFNLYLNTEDQRVKVKTDARGYYFVVSGSALDYGEEGTVGRGNKFCGLISGNRHYSMEAPHGKNPVYHVGKVYTLIVDALAKEIAGKLDCECSVMVVTRNGDALYNPHRLVIETSKKADQKLVGQMVESILSKRDWTKKIIYDEVFVPHPFIKTPHKKG